MSRQGARAPEGRQPALRSAAASATGASLTRRADLVRRPGAVRDHPRLLRLARAGRDRLRPGPRRPVRHPRGRQHRRAVAGRQRRVRRRAVRHAAGGGPRPLQCGAVRRRSRSCGGPTRISSRNLRSIVDRIRPVGRGAAATGAATATPRRWCARRCARTCAPRPTTCATAPSPRAADRARTACSWWAPSTRSRPAWCDFFEEA